MSLKQDLLVLLRILAEKLSFDGKLFVPTLHLDRETNKPYLHVPQFSYTGKQMSEATKGKLTFPVESGELIARALVHMGFTQLEPSRFEHGPATDPSAFSTKEVRMSPDATGTRLYVSVLVPAFARPTSSSPVRKS
jgi:hypothetical protein